ncbi:MAG: polynucleotide adenylyltransferase, partial [Eubacterium sp.]|nr:polynucleotide adenylyltransferase [Eubacterium sp.]
ITNRVMAVVPLHDMHIGTEEKNIKKWLSRLGENTLRDLIAVKRSDKLAQNPEMIAEELKRLDITEEKLNAVIAAGEPFEVKNLVVNGNDVMALGYKGREIGIVLNTVLEKVIDGELQNDKETIIGFLTDFKL